MNWQKEDGDQIHVKGKKVLYIYTTFFFIVLMVTTHKNPQTEAQSFKKRKQGKHGIPPNKINKWKHKAKELMEAQSYQKTKDKMAIGILTHQ